MSIRYVFMVAAIIALVASAFIAPVIAKEVVMFDVGMTDGPKVAFSVDPDAKPKHVILRTQRAGVAGSKLAVMIDSSKNHVLEHVFKDSECRFPSGGDSVCEVEFKAGTEQYKSIVDAFERGRTARITLEDAGVMKMDFSISLIGFTRAIRG